MGVMGENGECGGEETGIDIARLGGQFTKTSNDK